MKCRCLNPIWIAGFVLCLVAASMFLRRQHNNSTITATAASTHGQDHDYLSPTRIEEMKNAATTSTAWNNDFVKPSDAELKEKLSALQYKVTQHEGTERAFTNDFWDNKRDGLYIDIVSGEPLFSSKDKFKSGTGWPSFTRPVDESLVVEKTDYYLLYARTEVRSKHADSHLGHVFKDGPEPTGLRYCINSAALRFIPMEDLEAEGYGEYAGMFAQPE